MLRDLRMYLWEVIQAAEDLQQFAAGKSLEDYLSNTMLKAAVERKFEIIGEALSQAERLFPEVRSRITDFPAIVSFRNQISHGYRTIEPKRVWETIKHSLPLLKSEAQNYLDELNRNQPS